jgi:hypothetical protein
MRFKRYHGQDYDLQDLQWSQELLENSCDEDLRNKIGEKLREIPSDEHGGALYYYLMIELIQVDTDNAVRSLTTKLANMNIAEMQGENVMRACSLIRGVYDRLKLVGKVPHDTIDKLMRVFQTTSVEKFNQLFLTLSYNKDIGLVDMKLLTVGKLVKLAETKYQDLLVAGEWTRCSGPSGSTFITTSPSFVTTIPKKRAVPRHVVQSGYPSVAPGPHDGSENIHEGKTCWNCGGKDHISSTCSQPRGQGHRSGRGRGREGRGPRGGPNRDRGPKPDHSVQWQTQAPQPNDAHAKVVGQENVFWCGRCGLWNSHHPTHDHLSSPSPASVHTALSTGGSVSGGASLTSSTRGYPVAAEYDRVPRDQEARPYVTFAEKIAQSLSIGNQPDT